jgi:SAM-dependent methyltransferase
MHVPSSWFAEWFDNPLYTALYSHRSDEEALQVVELLRQSVSLPEGARVLDLCCGGGRHTKALIESGFDVVGIDLSETLLALAHEETRGLPVRLYRADMREAFPEAPFDCIANFFTSFGYFDNPADDALVLKRVSDALKPGGMFFLDFFNDVHLQRTLVAEDTLDFEEFSITQERRIEEGFVQKRIVVRSIHHSFPERIYTERVRLYTLSDFRTMFAKAGLSIRAVFGDYSGSELSDDAPRCIILAEKK